jgi:hypothetical protein
MALHFKKHTRWLLVFGGSALGGWMMGGANLPSWLK